MNYDLFSYGIMQDETNPLSSVLMEIRSYFRKHGNPKWLPISGKKEKLQLDGTVKEIESPLSDFCINSLFLLEDEGYVKVNYKENLLSLDPCFTEPFSSEEIRALFKSTALRLHYGREDQLQKLKATFAIYFQYPRMNELIGDIIKELCHQ